MDRQPRHHRARLSIVVDIFDEPLLTILIWGRRSADKLTDDLWDHGVIAHVALIEIDEHPHMS